MSGATTHADFVYFIKSASPVLPNDGAYFMSNRRTRYSSLVTDHQSYIPSTMKCQDRILIVYYLLDSQVGLFTLKLLCRALMLLFFDGGAF